MLEGTFNKLNRFLNTMKPSAFSKQEINDISMELRNTLLEADIPYQYVKQLIADLQNQLLQIHTKKINKTAVIGGILKSHLDSTFINYTRQDIRLKPNDITVIGCFGTNGVGKTSTIAKIANLIQKNFNNKRVMCVSLDWTRPAAQEQLKIQCKSAGVDFLLLNYNNLEDRILKIQDIIFEKSVDVLLIDTAGANIYEDKAIKELSHIARTINFDERLLVLDSTFGQGASDIIKCFSTIINNTGFIITKTESDQKGGIFFAVCTNSDKPIYYLTLGEKLDDIMRFDKNTISNALLVDGGLRRMMDEFRNQNKEDIYEIINKANNKSLNYDDLLKQLQLLMNFGKLDKILSVLPSTSSIFNVKLGVDTRKLIKKWIAIMQSMTPYERKSANINIDRMNRIAKGSGCSVADIVVLKKKLNEINNSLSQ